MPVSPSPVFLPCMHIHIHSHTGELRSRIRTRTFLLCKYTFDTSDPGPVELNLALQDVMSILAKICYELRDSPSATEDQKALAEGENV